MLLSTVCQDLTLLGNINHGPVWIWAERLTANLSKRNGAKYLHILAESLIKTTKTAEILTRLQYLRMVTNYLASFDAEHRMSLVQMKLFMPWKDTVCFCCSSGSIWFWTGSIYFDPVQYFLHWYKLSWTGTNQFVFFKPVYSSHIRLRPITSDT